MEVCEVSQLAASRMRPFLPPRGGDGTAAGSAPRYFGDRGTFPAAVLIFSRIIILFGTHLLVLRTRTSTLLSFRVSLLSPPATKRAPIEVDRFRIFLTLSVRGVVPLLERLPPRCVWCEVRTSG